MKNLDPWQSEPPEDSPTVDLANKLFQLALHQKLSSAELVAKRGCVGDLVLRNSTHLTHPNFRSISSEDLGMLFHATDEFFFAGSVGPLCELVSQRPLQLRLSTRMTSTGGTTTMKTRKGQTMERFFEIAIATTPLFETFRLQSTASVGGVQCTSRLEALQRIMEHEMLHLVEMLLWNDSNCSAQRYKQMIWRIFGHSESKHRMLTPHDIARQKAGVTVGNHVQFEHEGRMLSGTINRLSKRATVLVPATNPNQGTLFNDGKRYFKFYVPLSRLRRIV